MTRLTCPKVNYLVTYFVSLILESSNCDPLRLTVVLGYLKFYMLPKGDNKILGNLVR